MIACHNDGETLSETLATVDAQEECEVVVVDDGSDDPGTLAVLAGLRVAGRRVLRQEQAGPGAARMTAVRVSSTPYMFALDSDDLLPPGALAALADALDARPDAAIAWGDVESFGAVVGPNRGPHTLDPWLITYVDEFIGTGLIRREALLRAGGWRRGGSFENWDLLMSLCDQGATGFHVPYPMLRYRVRADRRLDKLNQGFGEIYAELRRQHESLFARRRETWRHSPAPWRSRLLFPVIDRLPFLSVHDKHRIAHLVHRPNRLQIIRRSREWFQGAGGLDGAS